MPKLECAFLCEYHQRKSDWLASLGICGTIFKDITNMGLNQSFDWTSEQMQPVPDVNIVFFGFSCKDLSSMNQDANEATKYVKDVIEQFTENPDHDDFDPIHLQEFPLEGSTAPTFIGAMQYVQTSEDLNDDLCCSVCVEVCRVYCGGLLLM